MRFNQQFVTSVVPEARFYGTHTQDFTAASLDSREVKKGELFIALEGTKDDGHTYVEEALKKGAICLMINHAKEDIVLKKIDKNTLEKVFIISVPDTHKATVSLAAAWRSLFTIPVIGITGSIGKTTTKEMIANIARLHGMKYIASRGNQNTTLGLSLNIFRLRPEHQLAILEMGISKRGEMARMVELARPTIGIITCIGHSHMEGLGSLADIANEKREIFKHFKEDNIGIIHGDQVILSQIAYRHPIIRFGSKTTNQVQARKIQPNTTNTSFVLKLYKERFNIVLDSTNTSRVFNALAAAAAGYLLGIPSKTIIQGIQEPLIIEGRFQSTLLKADKGILIDDAYNASPESMKAALLAFEKVESKGQKIAVLGDMLELGVNSPFWHRQLGRFLRKVPSLNHVILVGDLVKWTKDTVPVGITFEHVPTWKEATESLKKRLDRGAAILVKGSLGMQLKNLVGELTEKQS
jgi:UDP-N-acetylmuramoyl-tripeptide--D-alanyl-D-alanine ligase